VKHERPQLSPKQEKIEMTSYRTALVAIDLEVANFA
jgi:hypothetical protein